jgi:D-alanyl-D-alanine carboxypeptidase
VTDFDHYLNRILQSAAGEAHAEGSATVEAHHLLLAIAEDGSPALAAAGLDHAAVRAALDREFAHSLAAAGIRLEGGLPQASPGPPGSPQLGATAKAAVERGLAAAARKRDCRPAHVLLGVLLTPVGTVPRALELAGIDREALTDSVRRIVVGGDDAA